ncbi:hypothetical protein [Nocardiopsis tropica]|uniref:HK97 gp10 family phage protein n=1 Tax=Nocardiopsis tropica TaxID=109330 RepID=A0ABU7KPM2_9ACTN|nr:hypothetical protein [Nocardiopsis umidischolae]MEE2051256.1 hypothetical protein [Nocardiopsis umidischolae]
MTPEEQNETLQRIVSLVLQENSDTWAEFKVRFSGLVNTASSSMTKKKVDGTEVAGFLPDEAGFLYNSLRSGMYQRGMGAWYNAWTVIEPSGVSTTDFDYDVPPVFANPVDPRSFYEDIRYFPRTVERITSWLMEKLREAKRLQ